MTGILVCLPLYLIYLVLCLSPYRSFLCIQMNCKGWVIYEETTNQADLRASFYKWWSWEKSGLAQGYTARLWSSRHFFLPTNPAILLKWIKPKTASITTSSTHIYSSKISGTFNESSQIPCEAGHSSSASEQEVKHLSDLFKVTEKERARADRNRNGAGWEPALWVQ